MWRARRYTGCLNRINQWRLWQELDADVNKLLLQRKTFRNWNPLEVFIPPDNSSVISICSQEQERRGLSYLPALKMQPYILEWQLAHLQMIVKNGGKVAMNLRQHESFLQLGKKAKRRIQLEKWGEERQRGKAGRGGRWERGREASVKLWLFSWATMWLWTTTYSLPWVSLL